MNSFITGASGFIGRHLVAHLNVRGHHVVSFVRESSDVSQLAPSELAIGDVTSLTSIRRAFEQHRPDVVFHLAGLTKASDSRQLYAINEEGTHHLLTAAADLTPTPQVILVSTLAAAGPVKSGGATVETDPLRPVSNYGKSKRAAEAVAQQFARDVPVSIVRPPIVFGPHDRDGFEMFRAISRFGIHPVPSRRPMAVSWIHIQDLAEALWTVAEKGSRLHPADATAGIYFASAPEPADYVALGRAMGAALGRPRTRIVHIPKVAVWGIATLHEARMRILGRPHIMNFDKAREATSGSWVCNSEKLTRETGFHCQWELDATLKACADWYRQQGWL